MLIMTLFLAGLGATSTYAWFTANKTITVDSIQVNVETQGGIQISSDALVWKSMIDLSDLRTPTQYAGHTNQLPGTLEAVSSGLVVDTTGKMEMFYGVVDTTGVHMLTATKETEVQGNTGKFVAFDVFIKSDSDSTLYLTPNSGVTTTGSDTGIKNSTRIAFVETGHDADLNKTPAQYQALNNGNTSTVYLWEPNYDVHTQAASNHALGVYKLTVPLTGGTAVSYSGVKAKIELADNVKVGLDTAGQTHAGVYPSFFNAIALPPTHYYKTTADWTGNEASDAIQVFEAKKGVTKMRWYMWVEGQDIDCENAASGGVAIYNVQLTSEAPTP